MDDYDREQLAAYRKKEQALQFLIGWYGHQAKARNNAELAEMVRKVAEVLGGTLDLEELMSE